MREAMRAGTVGRFGAPNVALASRADVRAGLESDPLVRDTSTGFLLAFGVALAFAALVVAAAVVGDVAARHGEIALLRALGTRPRQVLGVIVMEQGTVVITAVLGGLALGCLMGLIAVPSLGLDQFVRPGQIVEATIEWRSSKRRHRRCPGADVSRRPSSRDARPRPGATHEQLNPQSAHRDSAPARQRRRPAIRCDNLVKIYKVADLEVVALQGLDLHVEPAEMIALVGASGSGKSTLMNILGGLDVPSAGRAIVAGHDLTRMDGRARTRYRRRVVGFVWQQTERNLLGHLSASENVELPMLLDGIDARQRRQRASLLMDLVGVPAARRHGHPGELSGGEQQRVAVAIALANQPPVLLADEPTGELDGDTAAQLLTALRRVNAELRTTIVIVTHDPLVSDHVQRTIAIRDGRCAPNRIP
jgi:ABC-type lipoprotein export system ATPase subunit